MQRSMVSEIDDWHCKVASLQVDIKQQILRENQLRIYLTRLPKAKSAIELQQCGKVIILLFVENSK